MRQPQLCRLGLVEQGDGQRRDADREQGADFARRRGQRSDQAAPVRRRAFEQISDDAGIFAADRKPITQRSRNSSQPAAAPTWAWVGSKAVASIAAVISATDISSMRRRPGAVADMAEHDRAERAHEISDREAAQGRQQRHSPPPKNTRARTVAK